MRLWDKGGATDADILAYTARDDHRLDQALLPYDILASKAHVRGLCRVGALEPVERDRIVEALDKLAADVDAGRFVIPDDCEDGHTAIEAVLVRELGDTGKRVHLGRSRNDQVLVATRLLLRDAVTDLADRCASGARAFVALAAAHEDTVLPGYTHLQRAVPQTLAHWALAFAEGFADAGRALLSARDLADKCPLGAAAGYGVNLPLDREGVAHELGFLQVDVNPLYSQTSRGHVEVLALTAVWSAMALARRLAWDLSLFSTSEFGFVTLPDAFTTGSSIMPNKRNPDVVELMRAACSVVQGALAELMSIVSLPSGYHRDLQLTKAPTLRALAEARATLSLVPKLAANLRFDEGRMAKAVTRDLLATDTAVELARAGLPFRDAYKRVAADLGSADEPAGGAALASVRARTSLGGSGNLGADRIEARVAELEEAVSRTARSAMSRGV
ncbi:MAG: argininosuccinate lyase [Polyangiaceae bacterium]|nr:argininosuccinate lyase [Polyangiaceae bacterium]